MDINPLYVHAVHQSVPNWNSHVSFGMRKDGEPLALAAWSFGRGPWHVKSRREFGSKTFSGSAEQDVLFCADGGDIKSISTVSFGAPGEVGMGLFP